LANEHQFIVYLPIAAVFGILLITSLMKTKGTFKGDRSIFFLSCIFVWQILEVLLCLTKSEFWATYLHIISRVPLIILPTAFFYFAVSFYRIKRSFPRWTLPAILAIPVITAVISLIPAASPLIYPDMTVVSTSPILVIEHGYGIIYYLSLVYQYVVYAAVGVVVIRMFRRLPGAYRRGSSFHIIYLGVLIATQIAFLASGDNPSFDVQYYGFCVCGLLFYFGHLLNSDTSTLSIDQSSVFDFLDQAVFILNEDGIIVETNLPAVLWLKSLRRNVENVAFDGLISVLSNNNRISIKKLEDSQDSDIHFIGTAIPLVYRMERRVFVMSDGITQGEFVTLTDVSRNRLLIDRLRDMAGVDVLTGTANRYRYQDLLRKLDKTENYPLAVVIGDVNGLKFVNDTYGHLMGDQYIKDIAAVLVDCCPKGGYVARYGGDEFATLLVKSPPEAVEEYIADVDRSLKNPRDDMVHQPSIAMGYAIKYHGNENLSALIGQADQKMYEDKQARKKAEREALKNA